MSIAVELPALGESVVEGTVARWLVREGDTVALDQPLVEVTTDKVDAEIPAPAAGIVARILVAEGETVAVGAQLALIDEGGPSATTSAPAAGAAAPTPPVPSGQGAEGHAKSPAKGEAVSAAGNTASAPRSEGAVPATPLARRAAEKAGIDLARVEGSGARGRIRLGDVEAAQIAGARGAQTPPGSALPSAGAPPAVEARAGRAAQETRRAAPAGPAVGAARRPAFLDYEIQPGDRRIPMSPLRRLVAEHMVLSKQVSPHVGTVAEVDLGGVVRLRDERKGEFQQSRGFSLSFLPFIAHATVRALREHPALNASVLEDAIVEKRDIHLGVAVETEKGLVVPVVRHADRLSVTGLAEAIEDLARRARSKKLSPDELKGGTFTVSNPGRHGNLYGFAIINQPQVGILRLGEIVKRPVVRSLGGEDAIVIRPIQHIALSYDHRAVDGAPANAFLHRIRELLEAADFDF